MGRDADNWQYYIRTDIYYPIGASGWEELSRQYENSEGVRFIPYNPNAEGQLHGQVSVSAVYNPSGETVILRVIPDPGYKLGLLEVTEDGGSRKVPVSGSGNFYTFTMPSFDVTVRAEFVRT